MNAWVAFSLTERAEIIQRHWGVKISRSSLRNLYIANGIFYRHSQQIYRAALKNQPRLDSERKEFAQMLATLIVQNKNIIYIDESSFHSWINSTKSWSRRGHPNNHVIDDNRFAVTVIGAIGKCLQ